MVPSRCTGASTRPSYEATNVPQVFASMRPSQPGAAMNLKQLQSRLNRLEELSTGLAREDLAWRKGEVPVMHSEVALYLNAIYKARQAIDDARNTLAKACERLEAENKPRPL